MPKTRKPHDHGDRWDDADVDELYYLRDVEGLSVKAIAPRVGRTERAVASKLYRLQFAGFPLDNK